MRNAFIHENPFCFTMADSDGSQSDEGLSQKPGGPVVVDPEALSEAFTRIHFIEGETYSGFSGESPEVEKEIVTYDGFDLPVPNEGDTIHLGKVIEDSDGDMEVTAIDHEGGYLVEHVDYVYIRYSESDDEGDIVEYSTPMVSVVVSITPNETA